MGGASIISGRYPGDLLVHGAEVGRTFEPDKRRNFLDAALEKNILLNQRFRLGDPTGIYNLPKRRSPPAEQETEIARGDIELGRNNIRADVYVGQVALYELFYSQEPPIRQPDKLIGFLRAVDPLGHRIQKNIDDGIGTVLPHIFSDRV
jgi:hypothetical protein